jgi:CO/xanthine dehydrogenase Mo-binding subunit
LIEGESPPKLDREFTIIGKDIDRLEGPDKATGQAQYSSDMKFEGMLYAKILRCPHAHARIKSIDTSEAEKLLGVRAVISHNNCPDWMTSWYEVRQIAFPLELGFYGQEVAAVAADTIEIAKKALNLIKVDYEVLPAVFDPEEALKPGAPIVPAVDRIDPESDPIASRGPRAQPVGNLFEGTTTVKQRGDLEAGFREADVVVERRFTTNCQFHSPLQTRCCVAMWDGGRLTVYDSEQAIWPIKEDLSWALKLQMDKIRVVTKFMGGGFGSKAGAQRFCNIASKLAMMTGRPVRMEYTRPEEFLGHPHRQSSVSYVRIGAKKDGKLCAFDYKVYLNLGIGCAYGAEHRRANALDTAFELYDCPNARAEQIGVYTNTPFTGYMRAVLRVMGNFPVECAMDDLAAELRMDPAELRMKNYTMWGDQVKKTPYSAKNLDQCVATAVRESGWQQKLTEYARENRESVSPVKKGIGIACYIYPGVGVPPYKSIATIRLGQDGRAIVNGGFVDIGGGQATMAAMVAAEELGMKLSDVKIHWGDSEGTSYVGGTSGSRLTSEVGPAILGAAYEVRKKVFEIASRKLGTSADDLRSALGRIYSKSNPELSTTFKEVCKEIPHPGFIEGRGSRIPNPKDVAIKTFGCQIAEVEVDTETGAVKVVRITSAHELGRALNPKFCYSQHYGAITMGLGFALYEYTAFDPKTGIMLNTDLHQYRMASPYEVPEIVPFNIEAEDPYFAYSAKGIGEAPIVPVAAAVRSAIRFATGARLNSTPMTPDKVVDALESMEKNSETGLEAQIAARAA